MMKANSGACLPGSSGPNGDQGKSPDYFKAGKNKLDLCHGPADGAKSSSANPHGGRAGGTADGECLGIDYTGKLLPGSLVMTQGGVPKGSGEIYGGSVYVTGTVDLEASVVKRPFFVCAVTTDADAVTCNNPTV